MKFIKLNPKIVALVCILNALISPDEIFRNAGNNSVIWVTLRAAQVVSNLIVFAPWELPLIPGRCGLCLFRSPNSSGQVTKQASRALPPVCTETSIHNWSWIRSWLSSRRSSGPPRRIKKRCMVLFSLQEAGKHYSPLLKSGRILSHW